MKNGKATTPCGIPREMEDSPHPQQGLHTTNTLDWTQRTISNADKRRIVLAAAACTKPGEIGALMRREGVYSSSLATWRRQYAAGELSGAASKKRGPAADPARSELKQLALMTRERDKLRVQLSNAQLVIEVQKKVAALLEQLEPLAKFANP